MKLLFIYFYIILSYFVSFLDNFIWDFCDFTLFIYYIFYILLFSFFIIYVLFSNVAICHYMSSTSTMIRFFC